MLTVKLDQYTKEDLAYMISEEQKLNATLTAERDEARRTRDAIANAMVALGNAHGNMLLEWSKHIDTLFAARSLLGIGVEGK